MTIFDIETVMLKATVAEKIGLLSGKDAWHTFDIPRLGVPSIRCTDGPNGARGTKFTAGTPAACLPCGTSLGATWNQDLLHQAGILIGHETKAKGAHVWLGPTVNMHRSPLGGRGFESFAEDPYLSGKLAGCYISGAQSTGIVSTLKHFVANDQEHERMAVDVRVTERALREIYLLPFQIAMRDGDPGVVMTSYNKVNGLHVSESPALLKDILRREWGFKGMIMSDWYGTYSTSEALNAGLDLEMPGPPRLRGIMADLAVSSRKVSHATLDDRVRNVLQLVQRCIQIDGVSPVETTRDTPEDRVLNRKLATESVVLLKNDNNVLPIPANIDEIALIGPNMKNGAYCGGGSAQLESYYTITNYQGIYDRLTKGRQPSQVKVHYEPGANTWGFLPLLGERVKSPDGQLGKLRMRIFADPPSILDREIVDELEIKDSTWQLMGYSHPKLGARFWADVEGTFRALETNQYEWGIACCGTASLLIDGDLIIDNTSDQKPGNSFFGRGTTEEKAILGMEKDRDYQILLQFGSLPTSMIYKEGVVAYGPGAGRIGVWPVEDADTAIEEAASIARKCKYTVVCVGLDKDLESEGYDRPDMNLPDPMPQLITAVLEANPDAIIVTQSGSPINMQPWISKTTTQVHMWYGGNETGNGLADVLFGVTNPSGKLPVTFPNAIEDTPAFLNFESERGRTVYGEGVYVGYRYYEKLNRSVAFPFGHGLSYTTFSFSDLRVTATEARFRARNSGEVPGSTVAQLYISPANSNSISRPKKELKGFAKVYLLPGEVREVTIRLDRLATSFWDELLGCWLSEKGVYGVYVGQSSTQICATTELTVDQTTTWLGL
ncbi:glycoside hydrolase superfamily [Ilyonectria robusta]|uniref:glycoside hydrolase superfamily n=1 Tax=Ilyonectria robusta TaxID=1079257 RepID=UPI001E8E232D|nr:glycoside hydrolase superfamily [Ilyonectria robusta]KAH8658528.1 glycoside hydrolase superfamily [Ilyonectria robusta]